MRLVRFALLAILAFGFPAQADVVMTLTLSSARIHVGDTFRCSASVRVDGLPATGSVAFSAYGGGFDWFSPVIPLDGSGTAAMTVLPIPTPGRYVISARYPAEGSRLAFQELAFDVLAEDAPAIPTVSSVSLGVLAFALAAAGLLRLRGVT